MIDKIFQLSIIYAVQYHLSEQTMYHPLFLCYVSGDTCSININLIKELIIISVINSTQFILATNKLRWLYVSLYDLHVR